MNKWLSLKDIEPSIKKLTKGKKVIPYKKLTRYDQVHSLVGLNLQGMQQFELCVKQLLIQVKVSENTVGLKGIGDLIAHLGNRRVIKESDIKLLREVVKIRNYISHHFYLEWLDKKLYNLKKIEWLLNSSNWIIDQAQKIIKKYLDC